MIDEKGGRDGGRNKNQNGRRKGRYRKEIAKNKNEFQATKEMVRMNKQAPLLACSPFTGTGKLQLNLRKFDKKDKQ